MKHLSGLRASLEKALATGGLDLPEATISQLELHWQMVKTWNARVNLTAVKDDEAAAWIHYRDSLEALALLDGGPLLDIGSGAGFPGIPLAIARPAWPVTLMEPRRKRVSFLRTVVARLSLPNVVVLEGRAEDSPQPSFAAIVTRATFSSPDDLGRCRAWLAPGGRLLAFRSDPLSVEESSTNIHRYSLQTHRRAIEIWNFVPDSNK